MSELVIQPTAKFLKAGSILAAVVFLGLEIAYLSLWTAQVGYWVMILPALLMLWPASRWLRRRTTRTVISGDRLRYELGLAAKSTRTIQLSKIQDVRVEQRLMQRMFNVGNLSLETAGETSRLTLLDVDNPQQLADEILNRAQGMSRQAPA